MSCLGFTKLGHAFDLDQGVQGVLPDGDGGAAGSVAIEGRFVDFVHALEVGHVFEEDGGFDHVAESQTLGFQDDAQVVEHSSGLLFDGGAHQLHGVRVQRGLAGAEHQTGGFHGVAVGTDGSGSVLGVQGFHFLPGPIFSIPRML